jgi:hypothetical protein
MGQSSRWSKGSISVRTFLKSILGLAAALVGGAGQAQQNPPREQLTLSQFIARVRGDAALRARFAANPRQVLAEFGIDPAPYNLPERISEAQMQRLLDDLSRQAGPPSPPPGQDDASRRPPVPVYGPPARPPVAPGQSPVAVYGPPPSGPFPKRQ